jgi:hypothetical protein
VQNQPAKQEKHHDSSPKDPLILFRSPLHHPNRITTHPQRISHTIQPTLCPLQNLPLFSEIRQHRSPPVQEIIQLGVRIGKEGVFAQRMRLTLRILRTTPEPEPL